MLTKDYFQGMNEADLRKEVLLPLLRAMGFKDVYEYHGGPGEKGKDIVCWKLDEVGNRENLALVVKATQITGKAQISRGTAGEVQTQIRQCFGSPYIDPISGDEEPVHRVWMEAIVEAVQVPPPVLTQSDLQERVRHRSKLVWLRDKALVLCLYSTGMRVGELVSLRRGDLDYTSRGAYVTSKGGRIRFVHFSTQAWQALIDYLEERGDETISGSLLQMPVICRHDRASGDHRRLPLTALSVERTINRLTKDTGILQRFNLTPRSFRHYFASRFLGHTGDLALTQDVMGHADPGTTRMYAKTTKDQQIKAHDSLFDEEDRKD